MIRVKVRDDPSAGRAEALLKSRGFRVTALRTAVLATFFRSTTALSADDLWSTVGFGDLSSVYRALSGLEAGGLLERCSSADGVHRYCLRQREDPAHNHFECSNCGRVTHFELRIPDGCFDCVREAGFRVASTSLYLSGVCRECALGPR